MKRAFDIEGVTVGYDTKLVLQNFHMTIPAGEITSIVGPNGCGKTTLLHTLSRVLKPKYGSVLIDGKDILKLNTKDVAKRLSLLPQVSTAPDGLRVHELVGYGRHPHRRSFEGLTQEDYENIEWAIDATDIDHLSDKRISELSGGQTQRVWLAMALAQNTDIILLDEPTTYLDMKFQLEILNLLKDLNETENKTIIMVLHDINHASRFSDNMIAVKEGRIQYSGSPTAVMTVDNLSRVFDIDAIIDECPFTHQPIISSYQLKG